MTTPSPQVEVSSPPERTLPNDASHTTLANDARTVAAADGELPPEPELRHLQLHLTNKKLEAETLKLRRDAEPEKWWAGITKKLVAIGTFATIAATLYGIWQSYDKTLVERARTREADQRSRFENAVARLEAPTKISKLVGVSLLSGYLHDADRQLRRQTLFALAAFVATEQDQQTQGAVKDVIASLFASPHLQPDDWEYFQGLLVTHSRAIMGKAKAELELQRHLRSPIDKHADLSVATNVANLLAANARSGVVSAYSDYRMIYCLECDFSGVAFPTGTRFEGALLDGATFARARLVDGNFDNAYLNGAGFVQANLKGASFDSTATPNVRGHRKTETVYVRAAARALAVTPFVVIDMPNFSCANLEGATFTNHELFATTVTLRRTYVPGSGSKPAWYAGVSSFEQDEAQKSGSVTFLSALVRSPVFLRANLRNTNFWGIGFFSLVQSDRAPRGDVMYTSRSEAPADLWDVRSAAAQAVQFQSAIRVAFDRAQWREAKLPKAMHQLLDAKGELRGLTSGINRLVHATAGINCIPKWPE